MNRDGHIRRLPVHVANKIAAGEVIERPASVLKELLENSIDAGSTRISVGIVAGGRTLVSVKDNGCGMAKEDAILSFEPHATSKIRDVEDIERIDTLGFRGEAVPSIASVSRFTMITRRAEDDEGVRVVVNAGQMAEVSACGAPVGTLIEVRDLFCNVPARRKFLRSYNTEESHIKSSFTIHALAHPDIGFILSVDGREQYNLAPGANCEQRIHDLFGHDFSERLLPLEAEYIDVKVHGYIERPGLGIPTRRDQYVFVNGRPSTAPVISATINELYPRQSGEGRPAVILFVELPSTQVDVNVHPTKREVRFRTPRNISQAISRALTHALSVGTRETVSTNEIDVAFPHSPEVPDTDLVDSVTPTVTIEPPADFVLPVQENLPFGNNIPFVPPFSSSPVKTKEEMPILEGAKNSPSPKPEVPFDPSVRVDISDSGKLTGVTGAWKWFRYLAVMDSGYLLIETDAGLVTINPVAARERISYEKLLDCVTTMSQPLLIPETVKLSPPDSARIKTFLDILERCGFALEEFGKDVWKIDAVPQLAQDVPTTELIPSIAADIAENGVRRGSARWREELVAKSIAKSYAGAKSRLTPEGAVRLVEELSKCRLPYVCPRNKPTMVLTTTNELARKFGK